jgi:subtilisin family serine protease
MYPAGFAPHSDHPDATRHDHVPLVSVGALNPDQKTIALFSNAGTWVTTHRQGAALVSTMPTTFDGSLQPLAKLYVEGDGWRSTIDPDNFHGGFAVWSGTSFSAPVLAGQIADHLWDGGGLDNVAIDHMVDRGWRAVSNLTGLHRPP